EERFEPQLKVKEHRHPFCEVRMVISGELLFSVAGNQFLLRAGDRIEIPANTRHSHSNQEDCLCICAHRAI
ncbi:MAG: cupin domain-containing protein, partial [Bdellovibrionia bacterium]